MNDSNYFPIELELLRVDTILGVDLYLKREREYVLYRSRNVPFNDRVRRNLIGHGVKQLYVPSEDSEKFNRYIENNLAGILADPLVKPEQKRQLLYDSSIAIARDLIHDPSSPETLKRSTRIVTGMVDLHLRDEGGFKKIIELMPSDYSLIHHSANVATYSIALGKALGISKNDLYELGLGALLHDIGKSRVPQEILYKPGKLTDDEFEVVKNHVLHGIDIASKNPLVPRQATLPILWHHERLSGDGYPYGKSDYEIPLFGMITAVSDSFDAMTTKRVYQNANSTYKALEILLSESDRYDPRVVLELVKLMGPERTIKALKSQVSMSIV